MGLAGSLFPSGPSLTGECGDEHDLLCWGWGREGTAPTEKLLDEHVDRIQSPLRSGQGHHNPERVGEAPTSGR